ncbi:MAG TPA: hypothetical protein VK537_07625 [Galbitalea sp.]|nr:hypothetical protein [Galbitalea sp.]
MPESTATATVETLTAEVRVLQVGNRQITTSVAKQLDHVGLNQIEPFGRIRVMIDGHENYVIGRDRGSGALSLAEYSELAGKRVPEVDRSTCPLPAQLLPMRCGCITSGFSAQTRSGVPFHLRRSVLSEKRCTFDAPCKGRLFPLSEPFRDWVEEWVPRRQAEIERQDAPDIAAQALPLIVLAGLR